MFVERQNNPVPKFITALLLAGVFLGKAIFAFSLGEETSSIQVNTENIAVPPGEKRTIKSQVPFHDEMGRFKANVKLSYGDNQQAAVFDTAQFFMIPLPIMIGIVVAILFFSLLVTYLIRRAFHDELFHSICR